MKIKLTPQFAEDHQKDLAALGFDIEKSRSWKTKMVEIDLALIQRSKLPKLLELIEPKAKPRTALAVVARDIKTWMQAINSGGGRARNCEQLAALLAEELRRVPGHRLYQKDENDNWLAYDQGWRSGIVHAGVLHPANGGVPAPGDVWPKPGPFVVCPDHREWSPMDDAKIDRSPKTPEYGERP